MIKFSKLLFVLVLLGLVFVVIGDKGGKKCNGKEKKDDKGHDKCHEGGVAVVESIEEPEFETDEAQVESVAKYAYRRPFDVQTYNASAWKVYWQFFRFLEHGLPGVARGRRLRAAADAKLATTDIIKILSDNLSKRNTTYRTCTFSCKHTENLFKGCKCGNDSRIVYMTQFAHCPQKISQVTQDDLRWALQQCIEEECTCPKETELLADQRAHLAFKISSKLTSTIVQASDNKVRQVIDKAIGTSVIGKPASNIVTKARAIARLRSVRDRARMAFRRNELFSRLTKHYSRQCKYPVYRKLCRPYIIGKKTYQFCNYQARWLCTPKHFKCDPNNILEHCETLHEIEICRILCKPDNYDSWVKKQEELKKNNKWSPFMARFGPFKSLKSNNWIRDEAAQEGEEEVLDVFEFDEDLVQNSGTALEFDNLIKEYFKIAPKDDKKQ